MIPNQNDSFGVMLWKNAKFLVLTIAATASGCGLLFVLMWIFEPLIGLWPSYVVSGIIFFGVLLLAMSYLQWRYTKKSAQKAAEEQARRDFLYQQDQERLKLGLQIEENPTKISDSEMAQILIDIRSVTNKKD